jgi:hypothetical protein
MAGSLRYFESLASFEFGLIVVLLDHFPDKSFPGLRNGFVREPFDLHHFTVPIQLAIWVSGCKKPDRRINYQPSSHYCRDALHFEGRSIIRIAVPLNRC